MTIARWKPPVAPTRQEQFLLKRLDRVRKLLGFLRRHRQGLFDDAFQEELASMYRTTGAGKDALPPALLPAPWPGAAAADFFDRHEARLRPAADRFVEECLTS